MNDYNVCENCNEFHELDTVDCETCGQPLVIDSRSAISVWRLGDFEDGVLGPILAGIRKAFGRRVVLQPGFVREEPSDRIDQGWNGISARSFLGQVDARHQAGQGTFLSLGITEKNMVYAGDYAFIFGLGLTDAAVMSLDQLRAGRPSSELLTERAVKIAVHELGHGLDLDHHGYGEEVECVMEGDEAMDTVDLLDEGASGFCKDCLKVIQRRS